VFWDRQNVRNKLLADNRQTDEMLLPPAKSNNQQTTQQPAKATPPKTATTASTSFPDETLWAKRGFGGRVPKGQREFVGIRSSLWLPNLYSSPNAAHLAISICNSTSFCVAALSSCNQLPPPTKGNNIGRREFPLKNRPLGLLAEHLMSF